MVARGTVRSGSLDLADRQVAHSKPSIDHNASAAAPAMPPPVIGAGDELRMAARRPPRKPDREQMTAISGSTFKTVVIELRLPAARGPAHVDQREQPDQPDRSGCAPRPDCALIAGTSRLR